MNKYSSKSESLQYKYSKMKPIDQQTQIQVIDQIKNQAHYEVIYQVSDQIRSHTNDYFNTRILNPIWRIKFVIKTLYMKDTLWKISKNKSCAQT